ncbi:MAG: Kef-type K+ transport system membrane component KefB [Ascidiaceihabitans sp.]
MSGAFIVNPARCHKQAFHEIKDIKLPFMIVFFILAGVSFDLAGLVCLGLIGLALVVLRLIGGWIGAVLAGAQASQVISMALIVGSTVVLGNIGPISTLWAFEKKRSQTADGFTQVLHNIA